MGELLARISCFKRRKSSATAFSSEVDTGSHEENASKKKPKPTWGGSSAQHPADDARCIIHRRNDPGIVKPRRPDHAENADDMTRGIAVGRDDGGRAGQRKQLVLRSDENPHALGAFRAPQQIDPAPL